MRTIIVDDEPLALELLAGNIAQIDGLELVAQFQSATTAMQYLAKEQVDLIICDIQMPVINGIQLIKSLTQKPMIIFVTAYEEYALKGFELDAIDYILKPVSMERFLKACNKALSVFHLAGKQAITQLPYKNHLFIYADYNLIKVLHKDIVYIEGVKDYVKVHTISHPKPLLTRITFKLLEEQLPFNEFFRVHKSYIVNLEHVQLVRRGMVKLGVASIPYSNNYSDNIERMTGRTGGI